MRVHFLRVYIFENTLLRVCFPFLTYLARSKREGDMSSERGGGTKEIAALMLEFFLLQIVSAASWLSAWRQRGRRKKGGGGGDWWMAAVHSPCQEAAENLACQVLVCDLKTGHALSMLQFHHSIPPLMASPPMCAHRGFLYVYASKLGTVQDDSG